MAAAATDACEGSGGINSLGVEAYHAYLDDITIAAQDITPGTGGVVPFLQREMTARGMDLNPGKTVALVPKGHVPTPYISLLAGVGVCNADEEAIKMVGVPVGIDEFAIESAIGIV